MLAYPAIDPVAFKLGPLQVHWYGLMYLVGFALAWILCRIRGRRPDLNFSAEEVADLIFYAAMGVIIGGRLGYILFYDWPIFAQQPLIIFKIWQGGMSFHGGLLGVAFALWAYASRYQRNFFAVSDFLAPVVPLGLAAGRIGNFINGELWGRVTNVSWGMVFPGGGALPRHPSEIYEFFLEGNVLFLILWFYSARPRAHMSVSGLFLFGYGIFRFICEYFREPDPQIGFVAFGWLTKGQLLSIPMVVIGLLMLALSGCNTTSASSNNSAKLSL